MIYRPKPLKFTASGRYRLSARIGTLEHFVYDCKGGGVAYGTSAYASQGVPLASVEDGRALILHKYHRWVNQQVGSLSNKYTGVLDLVSEWGDDEKQCLELYLEYERKGRSRGTDEWLLTQLTVLDEDGLSERVGRAILALSRFRTGKSRAIEIASGRIERRINKLPS